MFLRACNKNGVDKKLSEINCENYANYGERLTSKLKISKRNLEVWRNQKNWQKKID